jgi:hypothetical protein
MIADYLRGPGPRAGYLQGRNQDFKLRGGGAVKQILGVFRVKNHDFTQKNHIFSNFRGGAPGAPYPLDPPLIYSFISVSVCIDRSLSALLWPGPILLIKRPWPYAIHHLHFMNMYRLYIAWYRPLLLCMLVVLIDIFVIKLFS